MRLLSQRALFWKWSICYCGPHSQVTLLLYSIDIFSDCCFSTIATFMALLPSVFETVAHVPWLHWERVGCVPVFMNVVTHWIFHFSSTWPLSLTCCDINTWKYENAESWTSVFFSQMLKYFVLIVFVWMYIIILVAFPVLNQCSRRVCSVLSARPLTVYLLEYISFVSFRMFWRVSCLLFSHWLLLSCLQLQAEQAAARGGKKLPSVVCYNKFTVYVMLSLGFLSSMWGINYRINGSSDILTYYVSGS